MIHPTLAPLLVLVLAGCQLQGRPSGPANSAASSAGPSAGADWTVLFDGLDLDGWNVLGGANWRLDPSDASVVADQGAEGHLVTSTSFDDFELVLEFWAEPVTNSGVYIRCADPSEITAQGCYEVNISDVRPDPTYRTGAIVGVSSPARVVNAGGRWNTYEIRADGDRLRVVLNGVVTVDATDSRHSAGAIGLQFSAGRIKFRNVRIRPL